MFGGELDAGLLGGILKLDGATTSSDVFDTTTPVAKRVFYLGLEGGFTIAGLAGFTIRLGLSELGPLQVFLNVEVPGGILLEPQLRPDDQRLRRRRRVLQDAALDRRPVRAARTRTFGLPTDVTADQWLADAAAAGRRRRPRRSRRTRA